jgi:ribose transport system permease protein
MSETYKKNNMKQPWGHSVARYLGSWNISWRDMGTVAGLAIMVIVFSSMTDVFLTQRNIVNILQQSSINGCIAIGMTLVIISGGIDLSVGPVAALAAVLSATLLVAGYPVAVVMLAALTVGLLCGFLNGALIAYAGLQPFIVTLGTLSLFRALALIFTGGNPILSLSNDFRHLFTAEFLGFPVPVIVVAVLAVAATVLLKKTPLGEYILAVGGNEEAARVSGVPIERTKVITYMISGGLASLAAIILIARLGAAEPTLGNLWELEAIAAAAIGGASLMGGKGSIFGTILGAIVLGAMRNGLTLLNVQAFYQLLATGIIIILAMLVDRLARGKG